MSAPANPNPARITAPMWRMWTDRPVSGWLLGGIWAAKSGYHSSRAYNQANHPGNYSIRVALDLQGPADKAAAIDYTMSDAEMRRRTAYLRDAADRRDPRLYAVREFYGTLNSSTVYGRIKDTRTGTWRSSTSDSSHLWHIHLSFFRAYVNTWAELGPVLSVLAGESLAQWQSRQGGAVTAPSGTPPLRVTTPMTQAPRVGQLQRALNEVGENLTVDSWYGEQTAAAVRRLQQRAEITADGIYGPQSQQVLQTLLEENMPTAEEIARAVWNHRIERHNGDPARAGTVLGWVYRDGQPPYRYDREQIASAVWNRENPTLGIRYGTILRHWHPLIEALAEDRGLDTAAVMAKLDSLAVDLGDKLEQAAAEREELADLVRQHASGELAAEAVVDEIARRLTGVPERNRDG